MSYNIWDHCDIYLPFLNDFGMEVQANVVADYFVLKTFGVREFINGIQASYIGFNGKVNPDTIMDLYRSTLPKTISQD